MLLKIVMTPSRSTATQISPTKGVIIGVDPGLARTGIGVIQRGSLSSHCLTHSVVRTNTSMELACRLALIFNTVQEMCAEYQPELAAIERTFINDNPASSLALGQARGAALAALGASGTTVREIAPNTVKRQLTGDSLAPKKAVATMVRHLLAIDASTRLASDASDALAIALSCTHAQQRLRLTGRRRARRR